MRAAPTARPRSLITGKTMEKIVWGPNWEEILGGEFSKRSKDKNFDDIQKDIYGQFENTFIMYLPRLCEHCLNPACVASCPSGSIYKREEDGIVLIDQDKCRGWRMCVSGCPYKKIYYNWQSGKAEKCTFCYPRIEAGQPTVCSETCVGRIRYLGVLLYDADRIQEAASVERDRDLYQAQLDIFLEPNDPKVIEQARADGVPDAWMEAARNSPVYKMAVDWKVALPLHPEYRTLPMVWYVPPLSPISAAANAGHVGTHGQIPDVNQLRIPVKYLANLLTAGDTAPVVRALERMLAMRVYQREKHVEMRVNTAALEQVGQAFARRVASARMRRVVAPGRQAAGLLDTNDAPRITASWAPALPQCPTAETDRRRSPNCRLRPKTSACAPPRPSAGCRTDTPAIRSSPGSLRARLQAAFRPSIHRPIAPRRCTDDSESSGGWRRAGPIARRGTTRRRHGCRGTGGSAHGARN
jgi:nitrate reductase beta subunit